MAWQRSHGTALAVWPAGGLLLGYVLIRPRYPPVQLLGTALVLDLIARLWAGEAFAQALSFGIVDVVEIACAIFVARRQSAGLGARLQRTSELAYRLLPACFAASLLATVLKTLVEVWLLGAQHRTMPAFLAHGAGLWSAGFVGLAAAAMLSMELLHPRLLASSRRNWHWLKLLLTTLACTLAAWAVFHQTQQPLLYMLAAVMVFAGYFTGLRGAAAGVIAMAVVASQYTVQGSGPLALMPGADLQARMLGLQLFTALGGTTVLLFTSALMAFSRERVLSQRNLAKMMAVMATSPVGICFTRRNRFELVSSSFETMFGYAKDSLIGRPSDIIVESSLSYRAMMLRYRAAIDAGRTFVEEVELSRSDGSHFWGKMQGAPIRSEGHTTGAIWTVEDVTEARALRERLSWSATHDPLTDLVNRREFEARLADWLKARPAGQLASILVIDLDRFKAVNDLGGHAAGDRMLKEVAAIMQDAVRQGDTVARLGGDEFGILLMGCPTGFAAVVAEKILTQVRNHALVWNGESLSVGASIGALDIGANYLDVASVIAAADRACYAAKHAGRDSVFLASVPGETA